MPRQLQIIRQATSQANTGQTDTVYPPAWAAAAIFYINVTAMNGTTPLFDWKLQEADPIDNSVVTDLEGWDGITQLNAADLITVRVGPHRSAIDDTGTDYHIPTLLPPVLKVVTTLDRTTGDETYSYTISVIWLG